MRNRLLIAALAVLLAAGCGSGGANGAGDDEADVWDEQSDQNSVLAGINPCSLLTDDEIAAQVDLTYEPSQRAGYHQRGAKHQISSEADREGAYPVCHVAWRSVDPSGQEWARGNFDVYAMTATQLKGLEGVGRPKSGPRSASIEGVGDEAFYIEHAPSARVGNLGVSIAEFPDTHEGNGAVELLRAAVHRLR